MEFRPHPAMKRFLYAIFILVIVLCVLSWSVPVTVAAGDDPAVFWVIGVGVHVATLIATVWVVLWIPKYYESVTYKIDDEWLYAEGGVFWKRRSRLPISRVQMVNVMQGPWQRRHDLGSVRVYTAATGQSTAELTFINVHDADSIRDYLLELVQRQKTDASGLGDSTTPAEEAHAARLLNDILQEVRAIAKKIGD